MRADRGFSLLEALVALVVLAGAGMALFAWINASLVSLRRVEEANARNEAIANVVEYLQMVNPMLTPRGSAKFGTYEIEWNASPTTATIDGSGYSGVSLYRLGLYDTVVKAAKPADPAWFEIKLSLIGFQRTRAVVTTP